MRTEAQGGDGDGNGRWMGMRGSDDDDASWRRNQDGWRGLGAHLVGGVGDFGDKDRGAVADKMPTRGGRARTVGYEWLL